MCEDREGDRGYVYVWRTGCMGVYKRKEKKRDRETGGWGCTVYLAVALQLLWRAMGWVYMRRETRGGVGWRGAPGGSSAASVDSNACSTTSSGGRTLSAPGGNINITGGIMPYEGK